MPRSIDWRDCDTARSVTRHRAAATGCCALKALLLSVVVTLPGPVLASQACPGIHVTIINLKNSAGTAACALFDSSRGFPSDYLRTATNISVSRIRDRQARCHFVDIPPGDYALAVVHDENMNGKLDKTWFGRPLEGYGFSNNARAELSPPSFADARFLYAGQDLELTVRLRY